MSCDILLRKRVFARLASSAFFRAISSLSLSFCVSFAASFAAASAFLAFRKSTRIITMMLSAKNPAVAKKSKHIVFHKVRKCYLICCTVIDSKCTCKHVRRHGLQSFIQYRQKSSLSVSYCKACLHCFCKWNTFEISIVIIYQCLTCSHEETVCFFISDHICSISQANRNLPASIEDN